MLPFIQSATLSAGATSLFASALHDGSPLRQSLAQIYPAGQPPQNGTAVTDAVRAQQLLPALQDGTIFAWKFEDQAPTFTERTRRRFADFPRVHTLALVPAPKEQIFAAITDFASWAEWFPRVEASRLVDRPDDQGKEIAHLAQQGRPFQVERRVDNLFNLSTEVFASRVKITSQSIDGGLQVLWKLDEAADFSPDDQYKRFSDLMVASTLVSVEGNPNATLMAYQSYFKLGRSLFLSQLMRFFVYDEIEHIVTACVNRALKSDWSPKGPLDSLGLDFLKYPQRHPSPLKYQVEKLGGLFK